VSELATTCSITQEIVTETPRLLTHFASAEMEERLLVHKLHKLDQLFGEQDVIESACAEYVSFCEQIETRKHQPFTVCVKRQTGRIPLIPPFSEFKDGIYKKPMPVRECEAIADLEGLGLNLPARLALLHEKGRQFRAALITRTVPAQQSIEQMMQNRSWASLGEEMQSAILDQVIANLHCIHEDGYCWKEVSLEKFYPVLQGNGSWLLWLSDLESAVADVPAKVQGRDLTYLHKSLKKLNADPFTVKYLKQKWNDRAQLALNSLSEQIQAEAA